MVGRSAGSKRAHWRMSDSRRSGQPTCLGTSSTFFRRLTNFTIHVGDRPSWGAALAMTSHMTT